MAISVGLKSGEAATVVDAADAPPRQRVAAVKHAGRPAYLKRYDLDGLPLAQRLHAALARVLPRGPLRATPAASAVRLVERECRKSLAFHESGFPVPEVLLAGPVSLVLADVGQNLEQALKDLARAGRVDAHEALIVRMASELGLVHRAGLCHGRPHPRDMAQRADGRIAFFDFEEEPEAAMPMVDAQARDAGLLFLQLCARAVDPQTPARAFAAYAHHAPHPVVDRLLQLSGKLRWVVRLGRIIARVHLGSDLRRVVGALAFLNGPDAAAYRRR